MPRYYDVRMHMGSWVVEVFNSREVSLGYALDNFDKRATAAKAARDAGLRVLPGRRP